MWINFGGIHPSADVWVNGQQVGEHIDAPFVPFGFEVTSLVSFDRSNTVVVRIHEYGRDMGMAFNQQGNWSGLYRGVELTSTGHSFLESLSVHPDVDLEQLHITARVAGPGVADEPMRLSVRVTAIGDPESEQSSEVDISNGDVEFVLPVPAPRLWSPDHPELYRVDAALIEGGATLDAWSERTGFVQLSTHDRHFLINGEPHYMRGTGDFGGPPETGAPTTDRTRLRRNLQILRDFGYNYVRAQSFAHIPEYLDVADEVGLLVQSEMGILGSWGGYAVELGAMYGTSWPLPTPDYRDRIKSQWDRVVLRDVNHPSANMYCMGNELYDGTHFPRLAWQAYHETKRMKPTSLVIWSAGHRSPTWDDSLPTDFAEADPQDYLHYRGVMDKTDKPVIQHEFRWWASHPDVRNADKYAGGAVRPFGIEVAVEAAARRGLVHLLPKAAAHSQRLQFIEAKGRMEALRRDNPKLAGVCHFMAMDQNATPQGIFDEFYDVKYAPPELWRQTNGSTVILADLNFFDHVHEEGQRVDVVLSVSDFSHPAFQEPRLSWAVVLDGENIAEGDLSYEHQPFLTCPIGTVSFTVPQVKVPKAAKFTASLRDNGGASVSNQWDLWFYPSAVAPPTGIQTYGIPEHTWLRTLTGIRALDPGDPHALQDAAPVLLTERLDDVLVEFVRAGGRVVLAASEGLVRPFFMPRFEKRERYFFNIPAIDPPMNDGHLGTIIRDHPMLGRLPHEGFADLNFIRPMGASAPLDLEGLGLAGIDPVIRVMHNYSIPYPLAYLVECAVGSGTLIICALDLDQATPEGRYLASTIYAYALEGRKTPMPELSEDSTARIVSGTSIP